MYRILLVEDDPGIAQAVCAHLRQWELDARCVQNFHTVMEEFAAFDPQLVLLDISLPFFNGYHWCTQIRAVSQVPVVFLSSASENMNIVMAMNMGADDFVTKPFQIDVLIAKINALADGDCFIHGDLHLENVMLDQNNQLVLIDMMNVCKGTELYDVARTYFLLSYDSNIQRKYLEKMGYSVEDIMPYLDVFLRVRENEMSCIY